MKLDFAPTVGIPPCFQLFCCYTIYEANIYSNRVYPCIHRMCDNRSKTKEFKMMYHDWGWMGGYGSVWVIILSVIGVLIIVLLVAILVVLLNKKNKE